MSASISEVRMLRILRFAYVAFITTASGVAIQASVRGIGEAGH